MAWSDVGSNTASSVSGITVSVEPVRDPLSLLADAVLGAAADVGVSSGLGLTGALVGTAACSALAPAIPYCAAGGAALFTLGGEAYYQEHAHGKVDWGHVVADAAVNAVSAGTAAPVAHVVEEAGLRLAAKVAAWTLGETALGNASDALATYLVTGDADEADKRMWAWDSAAMRLVGGVALHGAGRHAMPAVKEVSNKALAKLADAIDQGAKKIDLGKTWVMPGRGGRSLAEDLMKLARLDKTWVMPKTRAHRQDMLAQRPVLRPVRQRQMVQEIPVLPLRVRTPTENRELGRVLATYEARGQMPKGNEHWDTHLPTQGVRMPGGGLSLHVDMKAVRQEALANDVARETYCKTMRQYGVEPKI